MDEYRTFRLASAIPWYLFIPLAIILLLLVVRLYRAERALLTRRMGRALTILRMLLPLLLLLMLLEPVLSIHWFDTEKGRLILLLDGSLSMKATDEARPPDEKVRLADAMGMLPKKARDLAARKLAEQAAAAAKTAAASADAGNHLDKLAPVRALREQRDRHEQAFDAARDILRELDKFLASGRPPEIDAPVRTQADKLKQHIAAHKELEPAIRQLADKPAALPQITAWDAAAAARLSETAAELMAAQDAADRLLARSDRKDVREAIAQLDDMTRADLMARLLKNNGVGLIEKLGDQFHLECYRSTGHQLDNIKPDRAVAESGKLAFAVDGKVTDLGQAVRIAAEQTGSDLQTAALVVLTDGQSNSGDDPEMAARVLAGTNVPLFTIGIGSGEPPRDIAIADLETSRVVYLGDEVHVGAVLKYDGFHGTSAKLFIEEDGTTLAERRVTFPADRRRTNCDLAFVPEKTGLHSYRAVVPVQGGELIEENNVREFKVRVIDEKIRVLYVEGEPRWEYRFLKNLLLRDKTMEINRIMLTRDAADLPRGKADGRFPESKDELFKYDVLILGDLPAERFFPSELKNIEAFAAENGGAVVVVCGPLFNPDSYAGTPIGEMLPVRAERYAPTDEAARKVRYNGFRPVLTHDGENSPITRLAFDKLENAVIWDNLPPLHWHAFFSSAKPGAEVLLRAPAEKKDDCVLLAAHQYGVGKVLVLGTDDTWRWRWKVGDKYFHKFWGQVMRWATAGKSEGRDKFIRMGTQKEHYDEGEPVEFQAKVLGPDLEPLRDGAVRAVLRREDGPEDFVELTYVDGSAGRYRGRFVGLPNGDYTIRLNVEQLPANPSEASVRISVADRPDLEQVELFLNEPLLQSMARITGGAYFPAEQHAKLYDTLKPNSRRIPRVEEIYLWTWPGLLVIFTIIVCIEWALRKRAGLM